MKYNEKTHNTACRADACTGHGVPAFAETTTTTYTITIKNGTGTYAAYQIFKGDLHDNTLSNIKWGDNVTHNGQKVLGNPADRAKALTGEAEAKAFASEVAQYLTDSPAGTGTDPSQIWQPVII